MSNIAVQGGAGGTGTVTLLAPSTSTDRTLTLPDSTGTVVTTNAGNTGIVFPDATIQTTAAIPGQIQTTMIVATGTWTAPAGVTRVRISIWGAGGGGGGCVQAGCTPGGSGGSGGHGVGVYAVVPGTVYTATIGAGGTGSQTANGTAGGESWFGVNSSTKLINATGGNGGVYQGAAGTSGASTLGTIRNTTAPLSTYITGTANNTTAAALAWTISASQHPGKSGAGESNGSGNDARGGVGGLVILEYVG